MFGMGLGEILVIGVVALLVIGPQQLPQVARVVGRLFGEVKKATQDLSGGLLDATREVNEVVDNAKGSIKQGITDSKKALLEESKITENNTVSLEESKSNVEINDSGEKN